MHLNNGGFAYDGFFRYSGVSLYWMGAGASKNGGEAANFCEFAKILEGFSFLKS